MAILHGIVVFRWVYKAFVLTMFFLINCQVQHALELKITAEQLVFATVFTFPGLVQRCLLVMLRCVYARHLV